MGFVLEADVTPAYHNPRRFKTEAKRGLDDEDCEQAVSEREGGEWVGSTTLQRISNNVWTCTQYRQAGYSNSITGLVEADYRIYTQSLGI